MNIQKIKQLFARQKYESPTFSSQWLDCLHGLAGIEPNHMLSEPKVAIENLTHPDANVRLAAIEVLCDHFGCRNAMQETWRTMSESDSNPQVRNLATFRLAECYAESDPARAKRILAGLIKYSSMTEETKSNMFAYLMNITRAQLLAEIQSDPEEVDWNVVDRLLDASDGDSCK